MTCSAYQREFRGWAGACVLENGLVRLVAVPDIGGRVMACDLGPYPFLFVDADLAGKLFSPEENQGDGSLGAWKNYGGEKTWPAPQGWERDDQWHGPPDPVLDTGRYTLDELTADGSRATVRMTSPADPRTGVQITRQLTLQDDFSRVMVSISFRNTTQQTIRWSIWDVVQLRAEKHTDDGGFAHELAAIITAPLRLASTFPRHFNVMFGADKNPSVAGQYGAGPLRGTLSVAHWQGWPDTSAGWIAFSNPAAGFAFCQRYHYEAGAEYPDGGASAEVWTTGAGRVGNFDYESHRCT